MSILQIDWQIIELVLKELPSIMQNRALLQGNDMESLATTLVALVCTSIVVPLF